MVASPNELLMRALPTNERSGVDAGTALCFHIWRFWPGATHRER